MAHFWLGSRNLDQIYGKLLQRQKDGKLGQRNVAQDAWLIAQKKSLRDP